MERNPIARVESVPASADDASTEARLLRVAARLFRKQGYHRTSTRELANAMGMQSASLYHYMKTKEDLLFSICRQSNELTIAAVTEATQGELPPKVALQRAIRAHLVTAVANRDVYLTTLAEAKFLSPKRRHEVQWHRQRYTDPLVRLLEDAQRSGDLRDDIPADRLMLVLRNEMSWTIFWFTQAVSSPWTNWLSGRPRLPRGSCDPAANGRPYAAAPVQLLSVAVT
jgi:TetR/AcrR family transcriptional regulator, cholesterol catabolism regulator